MSNIGRVPLQVLEKLLLLLNTVRYYDTVSGHLGKYSHTRVGISALHMLSLLGLSKLRHRSIVLAEFNNLLR